MHRAVQDQRDNNDRQEAVDEVFWRTAQEKNTFIKEEKVSVKVTVFLGVGLTLLFSTVYYVPQGSHLGRVLATGERGRTHRTKLAEKLRKVT